MSKIPDGSAGPSLNVLIQNGTVCQSLRAKTMFYQVEGEENSGSHGPFWCAQTQSPIGPDGKVADTENCRPGRSCCETA